MRNISRLSTALAAVFVSTLAVGAVHAAAILTWQSTTGFAGTEASLPASAYDAGIVGSGGAITRSGLTGNAGGGSINSAGFTTGGFLTFALTTTSTGSYNLTSFQIQDKPSATGPGNMGLYYSGDGFSTPIAAWATASGAGTRQESPTISGITLAPSTSYTFEIKPTNSTSNNGGSIGAAGTYRIISPTLQLNGDAVTVGSTTSAALAATASGTVVGTATVNGSSNQFNFMNVATGGATSGSVAIAGDLATSASTPVLVYLDLADASSAATLATALAGTGVTASAETDVIGDVTYDLVLTYSANPSGGTSPFYFNYAGFGVNNVGVVPEPTAIAAIAPAAMLLGRRRRA